MQKFIVWDTKSLYKILQDKPYSYEEIDTLRIKAFQNEIEGVRFLITAKSPVYSLNISVSDLQATTGAVIPSAAVEIGFILYYPVDKFSSGTKHELGNYPDAIIPLAVAKQQELNRIEKNKNQEIFIQVHTKNIPAGEYLGRVEIAADGEKKSIPLCVTIWDFALPNKNHSRQYFILDKEQIEFLEGDSYKNYERYYEDVLSYRVNVPHLLYKAGQDFRETIKNYVDKLCEKHFDERISVMDFLIYYNEDYSNIDYQKTGVVFDEIIAASVRDNINYFEKLVAYIWIIDEPNLQKRAEDIAKKLLPEYEKFRRAYSNKCLVRASEGAIWETLSQGIMRMPNILPSTVHTPILSEDTRDYRVTWCPPFITFDENRIIWEAHSKGVERWWYGCDWPVPPSPTYHIDDKLISSRLLSWMQYSLNVTGNLYWRINFWSPKQDNKFFENDPYKKSAYPSTHGEGVLIYPSKRFDTDTFVPSLRLCSIRDGIEDYEALYMLDELFKKNGENCKIQALSANELMQPIYTRLFHCALLLEEFKIPFDKARESLAMLLVAAKNYKFIPIKKGENIIEFYANGNQIRCKNGVIERAGEIYKVSTEEESVTLVFDGVLEVEIYLKDNDNAKRYSLEVNWAETQKKYGVNTNASDILKPYYDILTDKSIENYNPCTRALTELIIFIWKTEAVITKKRINDGYEINFYLPFGEFESDCQFEKSMLDEKGSLIKLRTKDKYLRVKVLKENEEFPLELWM